MPAPLYYNQDSIPDLMIGSNLGEWEKYNVSSVKVLDGRNGAELWNFDSSDRSMSSGLSIAATPPGFDAMLFFGIGEIDSNTDKSHSDSNTDQSHSDSNRSRRHGSTVDPNENKGSTYSKTLLYRELINEKNVFQAHSNFSL